MFARSIVAALALLTLRWVPGAQRRGGLAPPRKGRVCLVRLTSGLREIGRLHRIQGGKLPLPALRSVFGD